IDIKNEILMHLRALKKTKKDVSLQDPIGHDKEGNEINLLDILKSEDEDVLEHILLTIELKKVLKFLRVLDEREQEVIIARFGLNQNDEKTQREIAKELGISRSYVSRIEKRALMKMFHEFYREEKGRGH
ncbi:sigma-70 family RNA polymerase sigma factor, partial [Bacillus badius]|uniref:sigma-70 family RNA polymerase sigma factor n=1 Tax=Bacillus badius TaxID=1455 RepID=UPI002E225CF2